MMIKNIVFFIQNISRSAGSERATAVIANELVKHGYNITILSICGDNICFYTLDKRIQLVTLVNRDDIDNKKSFFKVYRRLNKFYKNYKADLVVDVFASLSIYTILMKKKFHFKNITWEHFNFRANIGLNKFGRKIAAKKSDGIVTLTDKDKNYYLQAFPKKHAKIYTIENPSPYFPTRINFDDRENIILSIGRLTHQKGFDVMIDLWADISKNFPCWQLFIVGSGEEESALKKRIEKRNLINIKIVGATNEIEVLYKKAKLYLSTSRFEGLPMTMIEAQAFGLPIISYDYDTGPSDIITNGKNGFLIPNKNSTLFKESLCYILNNESTLKEMSENALQNSRKYLPSNIIHKWLDVIKDLV